MHHSVSMADDVRNEILAASRSRTGAKDLNGAQKGRKFSQVKATFDVSPTSLSPERPISGNARTRSSSSASPTRLVTDMFLKLAFVFVELRIFIFLLASRFYKYVLHIVV